MKSQIVRVPQICLLLIAAVAVGPASAGGARSKPAIHHGHFVKPDGVAIFRQKSRGLPNGVSIFHRGSRHLPNGVSIFHRRSRDLPNGVSIFHRRSSARHVPTAKPNKPKHAGNAPGNKHRHPKPHGKVKKHKHAMNDRDRRGMKKGPKRKHKRHKKHKHQKKHRVVYGTAVYYVLPEEEYIYPEHADGEDCRHLTERGYDLSGRRVLVEWKLCFDENGEAYVPEDGRRILARY